MLGLTPSGDCRNRGARTGASGAEGTTWRRLAGGRFDEPAPLAPSPMTTATPSRVSAPIPPPGYGPGEILVYPKLRLQLAAVAVAAILVPTLFLVTWWLQGPLHGKTAISFAGPLTIPAAVGAILVHELVHGLAMRLFGYRPVYGFDVKMLAAYAIAPGELQRRNHALAIILAPLVVVDCLLLPLLALPNPELVTTAFVALIVNSVGATGDLYFAARLLKLSPRTLLCDLGPSETLVFRPLS